MPTPKSLGKHPCSVRRLVLYSPDSVQSPLSPGMLRAQGIALSVSLSCVASMIHLDHPVLPS